MELPLRAIAAVEIALWDLKAKILNLPLVNLLGVVREKIPVYGSGGFTSYSEKQLREQFQNWIARRNFHGQNENRPRTGTRRNPRQISTKSDWRKSQLFVDANGAFTPKHALNFAEKFSEQNVSWFEEPVSSDDLNGLRFHPRTRAGAKMEIAAGEYNYDLWQAQKMLEAQAVDVLQADATRCGVTGFLQMANVVRGI